MGRQLHRLLGEPTTEDKLADAEQRLAEVMLAYNAVTAERDRLVAELAELREAVREMFVWYDDSPISVTAHEYIDRLRQLIEEKE